MNNNQLISWQTSEQFFDMDIYIIKVISYVKDSKIIIFKHTLRFITVAIYQVRLKVRSMEHPVM